MVGVGPNGTEDLLARVSVVNYFGHVLLDAFIAPSQRVTDWRTKYSGIRPADVLNESGTLSSPHVCFSRSPQGFVSMNVLIQFSTTI